MGRLSFDGVIFDLDGVITRTASVHAASWKAAFDEYLRLREKRDKEVFREFTHEKDYLPFVDGKPRYKGAQSFLESRGIKLPFGDAGDPADKETVCGLANRKNKKFEELLAAKGAEVFHSTVELIKELKKQGIQVGVASSSKNCKAILESTGIEKLFQTRVDGVVSAQLKLQGKPEGDIFVTAAANIGVSPARSVVVEDAVSGVQAGRNGGFGLVLGVARESNTDDLLANGADIAVSDLSQITIEDIDRWFSRTPKPLFDSWNTRDKEMFPERIAENPYYTSTAKELIFKLEKIAFFLDYDGTLTPIVSRPDLARISGDMRETVRRLSKEYTVAVVSGRMRDDVQALVGIEGIFYAGSHGFDISGPDFKMLHPKAQETIPLVGELIRRSRQDLGKIEGLLVEEKKFSFALHYRLVDEAKYLPRIEEYALKLVNENPSLRLMRGKKVFEILPAIDWNKGKAIRWIMQALGMTWEDTSVVYIGDDTTDEDAFRVVRTRGTGILVAAADQPSGARFRLSDPDKTKDFFTKVLDG